MWFNNVQLFHLEGLSRNHLEQEKHFAALAFQNCPASHVSSQGWLPVIKENSETPASYLLSQSNCQLMCLQVEEKILPASVVRQALSEQISDLETTEQRKVGSKEKQRLKEQITQTLLIRAFTRLSKIYAYIDLKQQCLVINSSSPKRAQALIAFLKRTLAGLQITAFATQKLRQKMTNWLLQDDCPAAFQIGSDCLLLDPQDSKRRIRVQQQDLFAASMKALTKDGFAIQKIALQWRQELCFTLDDELTLAKLKLNDQSHSSFDHHGDESEIQALSSRFFILSQTLGRLIDDLRQHAIDHDQAS